MNQAPTVNQTPAVNQSPTINQAPAVNQIHTIPVNNYIYISKGGLDESSPYNKPTLYNKLNPYKG